MRRKIVRGLGPFGTWIIFWGASTFFLIVAAIKHEVLTRVFGSTLDAYVPLVIGSVLCAISLFLIDRIPRKTAIAVGIVGWVATFSLAYYWVWFGPGALRP
jgi:hypothetical protein